MNKKIFVFGIPILAFALVSAVLITYYIQINQEITVNSAIEVDGIGCTDGICTETPVVGYDGDTFDSAIYTIKDVADTSRKVSLVTSSSSDVNPDSCNEIEITPIFELSITGDTSLPGQDGSTDQDRVTANGNGISLSSVSSLNFDYELTTTTNGLSPYFVLGLDTNDDGVIDANVVSFEEDGQNADTWYTHNGMTQNWHHAGSMASESFTQIKSDYPTAKIIQVKVMIGYWGDSHPTVALVKNIEINGEDLVKDNGLFIRQKDPSDPNDQTWGDNIVDFMSESYFPEGTIPATYTITTEVQPL